MLKIDLSIGTSLHLTVQPSNSWSVCSTDHPTNQSSIFQSVCQLSYSPNMRRFIGPSNRLSLSPFVAPFEKCETIHGPSAPIYVENIPGSHLFPSYKVKWELIHKPKKSKKSRDFLSVQELKDIQSKVGFLRIWPSIATNKGPENPIADWFRQMKGIVLHTFGMGNAPNNGRLPSCVFGLKFIVMCVCVFVCLFHA